LVPNLVGNVPDWDRIRAIADAHGLPVIEDSCDVLDSWLGDSRTGTRSQISATSFARGHAITAAGNGGLVAFDDDAMLDRCLSLRRWGRRSESYLFGSRRGQKDRFGPLADGTDYDLVFLFEAVGYNFEPSEIGAAYALVQLDKLADYNERRRHNWQRLDDFFALHEDKVVRPRATDGGRGVWMRYPFVLNDEYDRSQVQRSLEERGVATFMVWSGNILRQPGFADVAHRAPDGGFPNADRIMDHALSLPAHHALSSDDVGYLIEVLGEVFSSL
jgi:CDP-6-deoxy-D-xylo-4-hexulose-3-dehydrase